MSDVRHFCRTSYTPSSFSAIRSKQQAKETSRIGIATSLNREAPGAFRLKCMEVELAPHWSRGCHAINSPPSAAFAISLTA